MRVNIWIWLVSWVDAVSTSIINAQDEAAGKGILVKAIVAKICELSGTDVSTVDTLLLLGLKSLQPVQLKSWADNALPITPSIAQIKQNTNTRMLDDSCIENMMNKSSKDAGGLVQVDILSDGMSNHYQLNGTIEDQGTDPYGQIDFEINGVTDPNLVASYSPTLTWRDTTSLSAINEQASRL